LIPFETQLELKQRVQKLSYLKEKRGSDGFSLQRHTDI
jgi:hypothetical protein